MATVERPAGLDDVLGHPITAWVVPWAGYMLGLLVGAALMSHNVAPATGVLGLPLAWAAGWLGRSNPAVGGLAYGVVFLIGLVIGWQHPG